METGQFTLAEYIKVKERVIDGKAPGPYVIAPEILKYCNLNHIFVFSNKMLMQLVISKQWLTCKMTPCLKSGNLNQKNQAIIIFVDFKKHSTA